VDLLYSLASDETGVAGEHLPVVARNRSHCGTGQGDRDLQSDHAGSYGRYMHQVGRDRIHRTFHPAGSVEREHDGWLCAFLLTHYTKWDEIDASLSFITLIAEFSLPGATDAESIPDHLIKHGYIAISMS